MKIFLQILAILPDLLRAILAIEAVIVTPKSGTLKKALLMSAVDASVKQGEPISEPLHNGISLLTDNLVLALNAGSVFSSNPRA